jgi:hypothetical protein
MTRPSTRPLPVALLWFACISLAPAGTVRLPETAERALATVTADALRVHVEALASDAMEGRGVGHPGNGRAEQYIADALRAAGVAPAAGDSYFQPVQIYQPRLASGGRFVATGGNGRVLADLQAGRDFYPLPPSLPDTVTARMVFAGHGISAPALGHDDYAGLDARGAIAVVVEDAPSKLLGRADAEQRSELNGIERKIRDASAHGASALVIVRAYLDELASVWPASTSVRSASYRLAADADRLPVAALSEQAARPVRAALAAGVRVEATLAPGVVAEPITVNNVIGLVAGREPWRGEMVVVGAHLDHDGIDAEGRIYNGADDNASGTAAVLTAAAAFARAARDGERPARAIVFALWNGEEKGSLGAESFAGSPQPSGRVVANINLDMVGRPAPEGSQVVHLLGYTYSADLARVATAAGEGLGLDLREEYDDDAQNLVQRSDNWAFLKRGIPAIFFTTGLHADYHTPDDDAYKIDYLKLERITKLASRTAWVVADGAAPRFKQ